MEGLLSTGPTPSSLFVFKLIFSCFNIVVILNYLNTFFWADINILLNPQDWGHWRFQNSVCLSVIHPSSQPWAYPGHILWISYAYLRSFFGLSWSYLRHAFGISLAYLWHILGIFWANLGHILGIFWVCHGHIVRLSLVYLELILGKSWA